MWLSSISLVWWSLAPHWASSLCPDPHKGFAPVGALGTPPPPYRAQPYPQHTQPTHTFFLSQEFGLIQDKFAHMAVEAYAVESMTYLTVPTHIQFTLWADSAPLGCTSLSSHS